MANFNETYKRTFSWEGYYSRYPNETYMGIDRRFHPNWDGWKLIDAAKPLPLLYFAEGENLSRIAGLHDSHYKYSKEVFWNPIKGDQVDSQELADVWYDTYWSLTNPEVIKIVQRVAGTTADGIVGPKTIAAVNAMDKITEARAITSLNKYRQDYFNNSPLASRYIDGWTNRVDSFKPTIVSGESKTTGNTPISLPPSEARKVQGRNLLIGGLSLAFIVGGVLLYRNQTQNT